MEKPGWGVVAVIVVGIAVLAFFLVFPNYDGKDAPGSSEGGPARLSDEQTKGMARDTMKVVDGTESMPEIVQGFAEPSADITYDPAMVVTRGNSAKSPVGMQDNSLSGYLDSLASSQNLRLLDTIQTGDLSAVKDAIVHGGDVNQRDQQNNSGLHHAALAGKTEIGELLILEGADVNALNAEEKTPLDVARLAQHEAFVKMLATHEAQSGDMLGLQ